MTLLLRLVTLTDTIIRESSLVPLPWAVVSGWSGEDTGKGNATLWGIKGGVVGTCCGASLLVQL